MSRPKKPQLSPGETVGNRYRIEGTIGRGGMGAIYEASHLTSGLRVALKVLMANFGTRKTDSRRFAREAALVQKLRHINIVQLLDFGETERGVPFIAFELLRGRALNEVLDHQGPMPEHRVAHIARDVLHALNAAHLLGIVHRDVKPANVFLCEGDETQRLTKVLDFGIAKALTGKESMQTDLTKDGQMIGTPYYMAPEQVRAADVGPQTDVYATGLVMAEMLAGERVISAPSILSVYMLHISDHPTALPECVERSALAPVIRRAIEKPLERRYGSAREMLADLEGVIASGLLTEAPVSAMPSSRADSATASTRAAPDQRARPETITAVRATPPPSSDDDPLDSMKTRPLSARQPTAQMQPPVADTLDDPESRLPPGAPAAPAAAHGAPAERPVAPQGTLVMSATADQRPAPGAPAPAPSPASAPASALAPCPAAAPASAPAPSVASTPAPSAASTPAPSAASAPLPAAAPAPVAGPTAISAPGYAATPAAPPPWPQGAPAGQPPIAPQLPASQPQPQASWPEVSPLPPAPAPIALPAIQPGLGAMAPAAGAPLPQAAPLPAAAASPSAQRPRGRVLFVLVIVLAVCGLMALGGWAALHFLW